MSRVLRLIVPMLLAVAPVRAEPANEKVNRALLKSWLTEASARPERPPNRTAVPFEYRTTNATKSCEGTFKDSNALSSWWKCFKKAERSLLTDFQNDGDVLALSASETTPKGLEAMAKRIKTAGTWTQGIVPGDGMNSHFLFLTTESGQLAALLVDHSFF